MRVVFGGGRVFDGLGSAPAPADLVVEDGRIVDVGSGLDGDERVDCSGRTLLPGLFDCHTHVMLDHIDLWRHVQTPFSYQFYVAMKNLDATLRTGITSVRDAGGADLGVKQAVEDGLIAGPRMQISIRMLSQTGGHGDDWYVSGAMVPTPFGIDHPGAPSGMVDGPDEMRRAVRALIRAGADVIKVATSGGVLSPRDDPRHAHFRPDELSVLVAEADSAGIAVMAHAQATDGIKNAVRAGIRSIEHGIFLDDEAIELMLERGTFLVPTLVAPRGVLAAADAGAAIPEDSKRKAREVVDIHRESFRRAVEAGVRIAMGTDSGVTPHGQNLRELPLMAEGGMTPEQVLRATTSSAAELLGVADRLGTLEAGKVADIVVVDGDALDLASISERIEAVYVDGQRVIG
ncbi:MAG: amidohydrolase family protein [Chloroflexi bacterium]|nr:amidohydrolase family protein [Chloroflexota bacterium]